MGRKTKLGSASRFGARYGSPLKKKFMKIEKVQKSLQICPRCERKSLKRTGFALWRCRKCGAEMVGGAYAPRTDVGLSAQKAVVTGGLKSEELTELETMEEQPEEKREEKKEEKEKPKEKKAIKKTTKKITKKETKKETKKSEK